VTRRRLAVLVALATPLLVFGLLAAAWAIDRATSEDEVMRNVTLAGTPVGGSGRADLRATVEKLASELRSAKVELDASAFTIETTAQDIGLAVDVDGTMSAAMSAGRSDPGPWSPLRWVGSFFGEREIPLRLTVDRSKVVADVTAHEGDRRTTPREPAVKAATDGLELVEGVPGVAIDLGAVADALPRTTTSPNRPIRVDSPRVETPPTIADATVAALVDKANATTAGEITLTFGDEKATIDGKLFRPGFRLVSDADGARLNLDQAHVEKVIARSSSNPYNATGVTFEIVNGAPVPKPGHDAVICCQDTAPATVAAALLAGKTTVVVEPRTITAAEGVAQAGLLGVTEVVGEFTTRHAAGQPRVKNIHRISDLTRGVLIPPGATWSVNEYVGRRTPEKGFVNAPVIENGEYANDFGGGVSQYATTLFNAAFFAGLDIPEHKAHSIYIERYPFAREATLAYPSVDLKIRNNSPYAVLLWPTYTDTSITVQLWSTRFAKGEQESVSPARGCGSIKLGRKRTFLDGKVDHQTYRANYNCNPPKHS
jgi:vancomycin resistance protein YoaR